MADEEVKEQETTEAAPAKKSKGPLLLIVIGVVVFVAAIGIFSVTMGVFSSGSLKEADGDMAADSSHAEKPVKQAPEDDADYTDVAALERELFAENNIGQAEDMDDIVEMSEAEGSGMSTEDSIAAVSWLDKEKSKLKAERKALDTRKKELDQQEYRLNQIMEKINQVQSDRVNSLARLYDGMKAEQVAPLLTKLSEEQAVQVLLKMKPNNAAKILGVISPDRAARISARMITLAEE